MMSKARDNYCGCNFASDARIVTHQWLAYNPTFSRHNGICPGWGYDDILIS